MDQTRPSTSEEDDPQADEMNGSGEPRTPETSGDSASGDSAPVAEPTETSETSAEPVEAAAEPTAAEEVEEPAAEAAEDVEETVAEEVEEPVAEEVEEPVAEAVEEPVAEVEGSADEEPAADEEEIDAETAALLAWQPGEWFVVHTYAGYENKVKANLETRIISMNMEDRIYEVVIPMEDVVEMKGGKKQVVQRKVFPGYLLVRMDLDDDSWYVVRNTPGVTGFVGSANKPIPLSEVEVDRILQRGAAAEEERPRPRPEWQVNDPVRVTTGPFANFQGVVSEIDLDRSKLKVLVNIFGRETPVELGFDQVAKV